MSTELTWPRGLELGGRPAAPEARPPKRARRKRGPRGLGSVFQQKDRTGRPTGPFWIAYTVGGKRHREATGLYSKQEAIDLLKDRLASARSGKFVAGGHKVTLGHLRDLIVADYARNGRRTVKRVWIVKKDGTTGGLFSHLLRIIGEGTRAENIGRMIPDYIATRLGERWPNRKKLKEGEAPPETKRISNATVNRELAALKHGFKLAIEHGLLATMPTIKLLEEAPPRKGFPEPEEIEAIIAKLPVRLQAAIRFVSITGWRASEVLKLEWRSVNLKDGTIRLESDETKGGEIRVYPYAEHPELTALIRAQRAAADAWEREHGEIVRPVFFRAGRKDGRPSAVPNATYNAQWRDAAREAGYPGRLVHDHRRGAARNLVRAGVHERVAMQLLGHRTRSIFDRYNVTDERDLRQAVRNYAHARITQKHEQQADGS